jgi:hypothetical protein
MQQVQQARAQEERQVSIHSLLESLLFSTCVHHLLECLGFAWCILIAIPIFRNMVCARTRLVVAINTQALCPKVTCIHDRWIVDDFAERI